MPSYHMRNKRNKSRGPSKEQEELAQKESVCILSIGGKLQNIYRASQHSASEPRFTEYKDVEIGSYPFFQAGKLGVSIVIRSEDQLKIDKCSSEVLEFVNQKKIEVVVR